MIEIGGRREIAQSLTVNGQPPPARPERPDGRSSAPRRRAGRTDMPERTYLVAFDAFGPQTDLAAIQKFITTDSSVITWRNYIPGVFMVVSGSSADELSDKLKQFTKDAVLLVIETNPKNAEGWLPGTAWAWIRRRSDVPLSAVSEPATANAEKH